MRASLTNLWPYVYAHFSLILGSKHPNKIFYQCCCTGRVKSGATTSTWRKHRSWSATTPPPTYVTRPEKTKCFRQARAGGDIGEEDNVYRVPRAKTAERGAKNVVYLDVGETCRARVDDEYPSPFPWVSLCAALAALPMCIYVVCVNGLVEAARMWRRRAPPVTEGTWWPPHVDMLHALNCESMLNILLRYRVYVNGGNTKR